MSEVRGANDPFNIMRELNEYLFNILNYLTCIPIEGDPPSFTFTSLFQFIILEVLIFINFGLDGKRENYSLSFGILIRTIMMDNYLTLMGIRATV